MRGKIGLFVLIIGGVFAFLGFQELRLARAASDAPEEISLQALIARGPDGNANIILKDFQLCDNYAYQTGKYGTSWEKVWVPVVPAVNAPPGLAAARPTNIQALIYSNRARNDAEFFGRCSQPRLPAMVINKIESLGSKEKAVLEKSYPGTDFDRCLIIHEGRTPARAGTVIGMLVGGLAAVLAGGGLLLWQYLASRAQAASPPLRRRLRRQHEAEEADEEDEPRRKRRRAADVEDDDDRPRRRQREQED